MAFRNKFTNSLILSMLPPSSLVLDPFWLNSVGIWDSMLLITCTFIQSHSSPFLSALPSLKSAWLNVTGDSNCKCTDWGLTYFWLKHRGQCLEKSVPSNRCWIQKKKKKDKSTVALPIHILSMILNNFWSTKSMFLWAGVWGWKKLKATEICVKVKGWRDLNRSRACSCL